jgi:hypothetical protein
MNIPLAPFERNTIGACCVLALVLFFFPLLTIHVPIAGDQQLSGYEVFSKLNDVRSDMMSVSRQAPAETASDDTEQNSPRRADLPLSIRLDWLIPATIVGAFFCVIAALIGAFTDIRLVGAASAVGVALTIVGILHTMVMNSDIHAFLSKSMLPSGSSSSDGLFSGLAQGLGALISNSFQVRPDWALYSLASLLGVVAIFGYSRVLARLRLAPVEIPK